MERILSVHYMMIPNDAVIGHEMHTLILYM